MNDDIRRKKLDSLFEAFSIISEESYVFLTDFTTRVSRWSANAVDYFGLEDEYMYMDERWRPKVHPDDVESYSDSIERIVSGTDNEHHMQYRVLANNGEYVVVTCRGVIIRDENGAPAYFGGAIKNHGLMSYIDTPTGLRSLYGFFDDFNSMVWKRRSAYVIMIGLNKFSNLNDVYGYKFGNSVLREIGNLIQEKFRNSGEVYRMDGTKFSVIVHDLTIEQIIDIYNEISETTVHDFYIGKERISVSLNAGAVLIDNSQISSKVFYSCLKYAYYESKNHRLGALTVFEEDTRENTRDYMEKLNIIRNSITDNCDGFYLCYQPIVNADTEELKGAEALVRWKNDKYGVVSPNQFIPALEQDPLFPELGNWILMTSVTDAKPLLTKYPDLILNVNVSYAQLEKGDFASKVLDIINEVGFPAANLCLEITERCRLLDMDLLKEVFEELKREGIKVALDDFGTGFSSIGVLREISVDTIKVDRDYVKNVEKRSSDQSTIKSISDLADAFSAEVCVEGVETAGMRDFLRKYSVNSLQGYYYSKPVSIEKFMRKYG